MHHYDGSRLSSPTPVGYVLRHDGIAVAALELTDVEPTLIAAEMAEDLREAVVVTVMSLAVLRDPANSTLGD